MAPVFAGPGANSWPSVMPLTLPRTQSKPTLSDDASQALAATSCRAQPSADAKGSQGSPLGRASWLNTGQREAMCKDASRQLFVQIAPRHQTLYSDLHALLPSLSFSLRLYLQSPGNSSLQATGGCQKCKEVCKSAIDQDPQNPQISWHWDLREGPSKSLLTLLSFLVFSLMGILSALFRGLSQIMHLKQGFSHTVAPQNHLEDLLRHRFLGLIPVLVGQA